MKKTTITVLMSFVFTIIFSAFPSIQKEEKEFSLSFLFAANTDPNCPTCAPCVDCPGAKQAITDAKEQQDAIFKKSEGSGAKIQEGMNKAYSDCRQEIFDAISTLHDAILLKSMAISGLAGTLATAIQETIKGAVDKFVQQVIDAVCEGIDELTQEAFNQAMDMATVELPYGLGTIGPERLDSDYVDSPWELNIGKYGKLETKSKEVSDSLTRGMIKGGSSALSGATQGLIKP